MDGSENHGGIRNLIFVCPVTGQNVQHRLEAGSEHEYEAVTCLACAGVHFINKSGRILRRDRG
jgi:RNase P subunit RPR2